MSRGDVGAVLATWDKYHDRMEEAFDTYLVPTVLGPFAEDLLNVVRPQRGERVVDIACGTGAVACKALDRVGPAGTVVGLDIDPRMLALARTKTATITWLEAAADRLPQSDNSCDVVLCQQGLQFFPDRLAGLLEMHRILNHGGRLGVSLWRSIDFHPAHRALRAAIASHMGADAGEAFFSAPTSLGEASELAVLLRAAGFDDVAIVARRRDIRFDSPLTFLERWGAQNIVSVQIRKLGAEQRPAAIAAMEQELAPFVIDGKFMLPMETHIAMARRS